MATSAAKLPILAAPTAQSDSFAIITPARLRRRKWLFTPGLLAMALAIIAYVEGRHTASAFRTVKVVRADITQPASHWPFVLPPFWTCGPRNLDCHWSVFAAPILLLTYEPAHFVTERAMLVGIEERAERLATTRPTT